MGQVLDYPPALSGSLAAIADVCEEFAV
jgi:hypothetical protein